MDLSRIELIRQADLSVLTSPSQMEELMVRLGFNREVLEEQPPIVRENGGGLLIWQYPNQFSRYLQLLRTLNVTSYLEIGCRWGGTFVLTCEFLQRFRPLIYAAAVDLIDSPVRAYSAWNPNAHFFQLNSQSADFAHVLQDKQFDVVFIDGDHTYEGVSTDFRQMQDHAKHFVFHDIDNAACPGVVQFWQELKTTHSQQFDFYEFTEQYDEVLQRTQGRHYLGIGVAVAKNL